MNRPKKINIPELIATCFYVGKIPGMPGTYASLLALFIYYLFRDSHLVFVLITLSIFGIGVIASDRTEKQMGKKDPGEIVIDEFAGQMLVFILLPFSISFLIAGFLMFRVLDIFKPGPIKRLERIRGGWGIMTDDAVIAICLNTIFHFFRQIIIP